MGESGESDAPPRIDRKNSGAELGIYASGLLRALVASPAGAATCIPVDGAILFLDIVDFTGLTDRFAALGPQGGEQFGRLLNRYFGRVFGLIADHGGDVVSLDGDSVIAAWRAAPGLASASSRAARAAVALKDAMVGWVVQDGLTVRQRIVVSSGTLSMLVLALPGERGMFLLAGEPLRILGQASQRCEPDQVLLVDVAGPVQAPPPPNPQPGPANVTLPAFLPQVIVARVNAGLTDWLAEFRSLTAVLIHLPGVQADARGGAALHQAASAIQLALLPLGLSLWQVLESDKGVVVKVVTGLPPFTLDNNAAGAVEAARRIRLALRQIGIEPAIGVASERTFCGEVGSDSRREYATIGPVMNHAARLMQAAGAATLCDEPTATAAARHFTFAEAVPLTAKGKKEPLIVRALEDRADEQPSRPTLQSAMFEREAERLALSEALEKLAVGQGGVVLIEAEPGAGKSLLLQYAAEAAARFGHTVLHGAAQSIERETSYFAFRSVLAELLGLHRTPDRNPAAASRRVVNALQGTRLLARAALLEDIIPLDLAALGAGEAVAPVSRREVVADIVAALLEAAMKNAPVVLILDDLHWIDPSSADLVAGLVRRLPRLLVCMASRPLGSEPHARTLLRLARTRLALQRLTASSTAAMIRTMLGVSAVPHRVVTFVHARAEGLPLFAEQLVLAMRDQDLLTVSPSGLLAAPDFDRRGGELGSLRDVIVGRYDKLAPQQQVILKVASVIGRSFDLALLAEVDPAVPGLATLRQEIAALTEAGLLEQDGTQPAFRHVLLQEAIYELLPFRLRRTLHRRAAEMLERGASVDLAPRYAVLATHWERSGEPKRAAEYRMMAAARALDRYANHEALEHLKALEPLGGEDTLLASAEARADYARMRGVANNELSEFPEARQWLIRCMDLRGLPVRRTRLAMSVGVAQEIAGQALFRCRLRRPGSAAGAAQDQLVAHVHMRFAEHAYFNGDRLELLHATLVALNRSERAGHAAIWEQIASTGGMAIGLATSGALRASRFYIRRATEISQAGGTGDKALAHLLASVHASAVGDWREAVRQSALGAVLYERLSEHFRHSSCRAIGVLSLLASGDLDAARAQVASFGDVVETTDNATVRAWVLVAQGQLDLLAGASGAAVLARLGSVQREMLPHGEQVLCLGLESAGALRDGDRERAERAADVALDIMERHPPTMALSYYSVAATATTYLTLARERSPPDGIYHKTARAVRVMRDFGQRVQSGAPLACWVDGEYHSWQNRPARAVKLWQRGLLLAGRLGMPIEQALCHEALARSDPRPEISATHAAAAARTLGRMRAVPWLQTRAGLSRTPASGAVSDEEFVLAQ